MLEMIMIIAGACAAVGAVIKVKPLMVGGLVTLGLCLAWVILCWLWKGVVWIGAWICDLVDFIFSDAVLNFVGIAIVVLIILAIIWAIGKRFCK